MSQLFALKSATSLADVANLLHYKPASLSYILYKLPSVKKYRTFDIPKRYGGKREICAPQPELKLLQRRLSDLLQNCVDEIKETKGQRDQIAHGFRRKKSILTNAKPHRNRRLVFNVDLHDFFGSINFGRVRGFFINDRDFSLHPNSATVLAQIACHNNSIPQGSPCSPVVSNLIGHILDVHLVRLASKEGCTYTRYADDLTFSTNRRDFPQSIAIQGSFCRWEPGSRLLDLVHRSGFTINPKKTRMQYRDSRQDVTGLIVNNKLNVRKEYRHTIRAMVHRLVTTGEFDIVYRRDEKGVLKENKTKGTLNQLHGMLAFINNIDLYNLDIGSDELPRVGRWKKETVFLRFLLFKEFYAAARPVIICEGPTDNVYLEHAIRGLAGKFTKLATTRSDGSTCLSVRFFKYTDTSTGRILKLKGGSALLAYFIHTYRAELQTFKAPGKYHPVIIVIDNDAGAE